MIQSHVDALVNRWMLGRYRNLRRLVRADFQPERRHLIVCEDASVQKIGTEENPCETCGTLLRMAVRIVCPHGIEDGYRWTYIGSLAGLISELEALNDE